jgi:hypothetical protein
MRPPEGSGRLCFFTFPHAGSAEEAGEQKKRSTHRFRCWTGRGIGPAGQGIKAILRDWAAGDGRVENLFDNLSKNGHSVKINKDMRYESFRTTTAKHCHSHDGAG